MLLCIIIDHSIHFAAGCSSSVSFRHSALESRNEVTYLDEKDKKEIKYAPNSKLAFKLSCIIFNRSEIYPQD